MTALSLAQVLKKGESILILERGTWWTTPVGTGSVGWAIPLDPDVRCIHMGDISELGIIVSGAFLHADKVGNGEYLPLVGDFLSFNEIVETLNQQGRKLSVKQVPTELLHIHSCVAFEKGT